MVSRLAWSGQLYTTTSLRLHVLAKRAASPPQVAAQDKSGVCFGLQGRKPHGLQKCPMTSNVYHPSGVAGVDGGGCVPYSICKGAAPRPPAFHGSPASPNHELLLLDTYHCSRFHSIVQITVLNSEKEVLEESAATANAKMQESREAMAVQAKQLGQLQYLPPRLQDMQEQV